MGLLDDFDMAFSIEEPSPQPWSGSSTLDPFQLALQDVHALHGIPPAPLEGGRDRRAPLGAKHIHTPGDFRLRYDTEAPLRAIDNGGPGQEQRIADFMSREIDNRSQGLDVSSARKFLGLENSKSILPGTDFRLLDHQAIGVAWMAKMEIERKEKGGILADDMGLGKTVQMIALMAKNQPKYEDENKTTLVVVPAALMQQWKDEVETKTNGLFSAHIHHGKDRLKKVSEVRRKDVVITSYQTLCMDFITPKDIESWQEAEWLAKNGGPLARTTFYRVIADEAQFIRNRSTRSSVSMAYVRAKYRWMLTGTPVTNSLADLYGLLRFGRFKPWNDWPSFNDHIARLQIEDAQLAGQRAQIILKPLLLRRTKDSTLEGKPILNLPLKEIELVKLQFSPGEQKIYDSFESRAKAQLNKFIREQTLVKHHRFVLVMILRLRQLCCHPNLIPDTEGHCEGMPRISSDDRAEEISRSRRIMGNAWVQRIKQDLLMKSAATEFLDFQDEEEDEKTSASCCPECGEVYDGNGRFLMCGHEACFECIQNIRNSPITHSGIFGYGSEEENLAAEMAYNKAEAKGHRPCPSCKKMINMNPDHIFKVAAFEPSGEESSMYAQETRNDKGRAMRKADAFKRDVKPQPQPPSNSIVVLSDPDGGSLPDRASTLTPVKKRSKSQKATIRRDDVDSTEQFISTSRPNGIKKKPIEDEDSDVVYLGMSYPSRGVHSGKRKAPGSESDSDVEVVAVTPSRKKKRATASRAFDVASKEEAKRATTTQEPSDRVLAMRSRGDDDMEPSTKIVALVNYLKAWDKLGDKSICYSQWTSMLDLLDIVLAREGVCTLRFDGKMDRVERDRTVATFKRPGGPKVMLISTKAGSVGLNLVCANRVVNMDLSWNYASESQAYDRVHRIGQDKPVFIKRLVVENTIEERMLRLQDVKTRLGEEALGEGVGGKLHELSVKDIKYLFGMTPAKPSAPAGRNDVRGQAPAHERPL